MMIDSENQIMGLWDNGHSIESICKLIGRERAYVDRIVRRFTMKDDDRFEAPARLASQRLLAAIQRAGLHA